MKDGLFKSYFKIFISTLTACVIFLGITLLIFSGINYTSQKQDILRSAAAKAGEGASLIYTGTSFPVVPLYSLLSEVSVDYGVSVFVTDESGNIVACSEKECHHENASIGKAIKVIEKSGEYDRAGYFQGIVGRTSDFVVGLPVLYKGNNAGYVFATTSVAPLFAYLYETMFTYLFSAGIMLLVAFAVIYTTTMQLTAPLKEMSKAAENFGKGNFDSRVEVAGDDEIAVLARSFNQMAESLAEFEKNRRSFVANVSHDLRTPMTTIGGYIDGILDGTIPREEEGKYLEIVSQEVKRLSRLTSSLLSVMKLEEHQGDPVELVSVDARDIIINILFNMEKRIEEKKIYIPDLEIQDILYVKADKDMLHQVVYNLMDNAVKYTPVGGEIRIEVTSDSAKSSISVYNTGKGISKEDQSSIFERFYKTDKSRGIDRNGSGLGLYIVKMLTNGMNGNVSVESDGESYTRFTVVLDTAAVPKDLIVVKTRPEEKTEKTKKKESSFDWRKAFSVTGYFRTKLTQSKKEEKNDKGSG